MISHVTTMGLQELLPLILIFLAAFHSIDISLRCNGPKARRWGLHVRLCRHGDRPTTLRRPPVTQKIAKPGKALGSASQNAHH